MPLPLPEVKSHFFFFFYSRTLLFEFGEKIFLFFPANLPANFSSPRKPLRPRTSGPCISPWGHRPISLAGQSLETPPPPQNCFPSPGEDGDLLRGVAGVCHPASACLLALRLPPTCPGAPNPESTRPTVRSGSLTRRLPLTLDEWEGEAARGAGPLRPLREH